MVVKVVCRFPSHKSRLLRAFHFYKKTRPQNAISFCNAGNRNRTGTGVTTHRILSPGRLPVPPHQHIFYFTDIYHFYAVNDPGGTRTLDLCRDRAAL